MKTSDIAIDREFMVVACLHAINYINYKPINLVCFYSSVHRYEMYSIML